MDNVSSKISFIKAVSIVKLIVGIPLGMFGVFTVLGGLLLPITKGFSLYYLVGYLEWLAVTTACFIAVINGIKTLILIRMYPTYTETLSGNQPDSIASLASSLNITVDVAMKNVCTMLSWGLFPDCYIDMKNKMLVTPDKKVEQTEIPEVQIVNPEVEYVTVKCAACGAENKIAEGIDSVCEYCGSEVHS